MQPGCAISSLFGNEATINRLQFTNIGCPKIGKRYLWDIQGSTNPADGFSMQYGSTIPAWAVPE